MQFESPSAPLPRSALYGRRNECRMLDRLLDDARAGGGGALVLRGEAGIGKSALLEYSVSRASDMRVYRATGVESEMEFAYAGLQQLCAPFLGMLERIPGPQRDALATVFGLDNGPPPNTFLVGLGVLSLLSHVAEEGPHLTVVDDAQWLDKASTRTISFVTRRLNTRAAVLLLAVRVPGADGADEDRSNPHGFDELPVLDVKGLSPSDSLALLNSVLIGPVEEPVRRRIVAETRGNPLALLELTRGRTPAELAFGFRIPDATPMSSRIERRFVQRLESLPTQTRLLLLLAAAEPSGDVPTVWRAARTLGIEGQAAVLAERAGLIDGTDQFRFRHPLVRSAVYGAADPEDRRRVHLALAQVTDPEGELDRRAWHRGKSTDEPNEEIATELERSADRAQTRGGSAAAAAFLRRAAELSPDPGRRAARLLTAAQAELQSGALQSALDLLEAAQAGPFDELGQARIDLLRAQIAFNSNRGADAPYLLLSAARNLERLDAGLAKNAYLEALSASMFAGHLTSESMLREVAEAARNASPSPGEPSARDLLLTALAQLVTDTYAAAATVSREAVFAFAEEDLPPGEAVRWLWLASAVAANLWDDEHWDALTSLHLRLARESGALTELALALNARAEAQIFAGELKEAALLVDEARSITEATGVNLAPYGDLALTAVRGADPAFRELIEVTVSEAQARGEGFAVTVADWASALHALGPGHYKEALAAAERATGRTLQLAVSKWALADLIESAARTGRTSIGAEELERLSTMTQASGSDWALGVEARSRALLSESDAAEAHYRSAIDHLARTRMRLELARAHLLYGEWLRREGRRADARYQLRNAHVIFDEMDAVGFTERALRELAATGEVARDRNPEADGKLTPQEAHIARLASAGKTNPEIGAELFISPRTVEWHLRRIFVKLGIHSRRELIVAGPDATPDGAAQNAGRSGDS